jgi:uncharacterized membrane protein YcaP (DUF421 family)
MDQGPLENISFLLAAMATVVDLLLVVLMGAAVVRAHANRQIHRRQMCSFLAFILLVFIPPILVMWILYLRK